MATTPIRILQRRSAVSGLVPQLCTLASGELFVQLADATIYFRNDKNQLVCTLTDKNLGNLCSMFAPTGNYVFTNQTGSFITTSQTGAFASIGNYVNTSQTGNFITTSQTGAFAPIGDYVTSNETGDFITASQAVAFAPTGNYVEIVNGFVPAQYLPAYVDQILEFGSIQDFCNQNGNSNYIYVISGCSSFWRWGSSQYVEIFASPGTSDGIPEGINNLYFTSQRSACYVAKTQTGCFVTAAQTGTLTNVFAATGNYVLNSQTGILINTFAPTGNYVQTVCGQIPSQYLPSYVDEITGSACVQNFCNQNGNPNYIYTVSGCNSFWRWDGSQYIEIFASPGTSDSVAEGINNLYFTAQRSACYVAKTETGSFITTSMTGAFAVGGEYVTVSQTGKLTGAFAPVDNYVTTSQTGNLSSVFAPVGNYVTTSQTGNLSSVFAPVGNYAIVVDGHIPSQYLPSYVDDIEEFNTTGSLYAHSGERGHIYLVSGCNSFWRWGGSQYVEIYASPGTSDGLVEGSTNLYFTAARSVGYVATGSTGEFIIGKVGTNVNLGDSSNKSCLNEKSFLGAGVNNNQSGICCSFLGAGKCNQQHGYFSGTSLISGLSLGEISFLGAGCCNRQCGTFASFLGAGQNVKQHLTRSSFVGAGHNITQSGTIGSFVGAGYYIWQDSSSHSFIGAGYNNILCSQFQSAITAGYNNVIAGINDTGFYGSFIGAGFQNFICGSTHASILAGCNNKISGSKESSIVAGSCNCQSKVGQSFIGGGDRNKQIICSKNLYNFPCENAFIGAGEGNIQECEILNSFIGAGETNYQKNIFDSFIGAGALNCQDLDHLSFIGAGSQNCQKCSCASFIGAGSCNSILSGECNFLGAGTKNNIINSYASSILAGTDNQISGGKNVFVLGSGITAQNQTNTLFVNNLCVLGSILGGGGGSSLCSGVNTIYESFSITGGGVNTNLINFDVLPNSTLFYVGNSASNFYLNLRGNSSCTLNSLLPLNNSLSTTFIHANSTTAYCLTGVNIDGVAQSLKWAGGGGTAGGITSSANSYSITVFKTGNNLYCTFVSLGFFA